MVDRAMAEARRAIADRDDWWVPVLVSRLRTGRTYYRPEFAQRADATWETLKLQIRTGNFTPVLGPGLADAILGSRQDIARGFVERWQMPLARHNQGDLAQVAQYLRVRSAEGTVRAQLFDYLAMEITKRRDAATGPEDPFWELGEVDPQRPGPSIVEVGRRLRKDDPGDPYRVMAELPVKVYVTTAWTNLLQDALLNREEPRKPTTMVFRWRDAGMNGGSPQDLIEEPTREHPLVYHLFGRFDHPQSLVLTEEDYFGWFTAWHTRAGGHPGGRAERARREVAALRRLPSRRLGLPRHLPGDQELRRLPPPRPEPPRRRPAQPGEPADRARGGAGVPRVLLRRQGQHLLGRHAPLPRRAARTAPG